METKNISNLIPRKVYELVRWEKRYEILFIYSFDLAKNNEEKNPPADQYDDVLICFNLKLYKSFLEF